MKKYIAYFCLIVIACFCFSACKSEDYERAVTLEEAGNYSEALEIYNTLSGYKDSAERVNVCVEMITEIEAYNEAVGLYNDTASALSLKNAALDEAIASAQALLSEGNLALDNTLLPALETAIAETKAQKVELPALPDNTADILALLPAIEIVDYSEVLMQLIDAQSAAETSIAQYALVNAPSEAYIIECLSRVPGIIGISAATEDNDPNQQLNKAGGYTAQVYFSYELIDQNTVSGSTIIEKGTICGGSIEVYSSAEDAEKRNTYLSAFDGTIFATGSHVVVGTVVVRTSHKLTASQQKELEANIIEALTSING